MSDDDLMTRRATLRAGATLLFASASTTTAVATDTQSEAKSTNQPDSIRQPDATHQPDGSQLESAESETDSATGVYYGTIDRIVDDQHVVILLESDDEIIGQEVLNRERVADGEEGDRVAIILFRGQVLSVQVQ